MILPPSNTGRAVIWRCICAFLALTTASLSILSAMARYDRRPVAIERAAQPQHLAQASFAERWP